MCLNSNAYQFKIDCYRTTAKHSRKPAKQSTEQNGSKYIPVHNYVKCKWTKFSNQKL